MAAPGSTVRVSGPPTDIENNRLQDKLLIHFLRARNGGGEVDSVIIVKATPLSALITFEDRAVAQRVIQRSRHILEVDGKKYELTATKHQESLDPDRVILSLSATVDYSQLPGGVEVLTNLWKNHREIQINYTAAEMCCTLFGSYSKVQAALTQLLGYPGGPEPVENKDSGQASPSSSCSVQTLQKPQVSEDQNRKHNRVRRKRDNTDRPSDEDHSSSNRSVAPDDEGWEATTNTDDAALQSPAALMEDFSLIVDADMFQYLQKHCKKEYQRILSQNGVEVENVTQQGVTTLFLQAADTAAMEGVQVRLELAKKAISQLYQQNEAMIRRAQLSKGILRPRGGLQKALENLTDRFPKLLLNEDEQNIYIIGSIKDVSEAKSFLILDRDGVRDKKEDVASLLKSPLYNSSLSPTHADGAGVSLTPLSTLASSDEKTDQMLRSDEEGLRAEVATKYKLAARFKDSGLTGLGSRPADFTVRTSSSSSRQTYQGPMLGHDVLSELAGTSGEAVSRAQHTGGDILFKTTSPSTASMQSKTSLTDTHSNNSPPPFSEHPPFGSGSTLRRTSSFSGTPQRKAQVVGQISQDDSSKTTVRSRGRSSSFSSQTVRDKQEVHCAGIPVSKIMWHYIKQAYSTRVEDLTTDVLLEETALERSRELNVTIRGADSSKVRSCQERLQRLVESVSADFTVKEILFSELSVTDPQDETLQACCTEVRSRFKKVTVHIGRKGLYLFGPDQLCSQVAATLREVFSGKPEPYIFSSPSMLMWNSASPSQFDVTQSFSLQLNNSSQVVLGTQTGQTDSQQWKTTYKSDFGEKGDVNGAYSQSPVRKDLFSQEKVKISRKEDGQKAEESVSLTTNDTSSVNGISSVASNKDRTIRATQTDSTKHRNAEVQNTPEESRSGLVLSCVCGKNGTSLMRTKCGVTLCPRCLETLHLRCRVCSETEQTPQGILGEMKVSKVPINLPGHNKDNTIKITYSIPDGIQGEGHPAPGKPFKGGVFDAYLPDSEKTKKLVPRLKEAFRQGLTFTVREKGVEAQVDWDCIPHKTRIHGGIAQKAYPDSAYLTRLSDILTSHKIE